MWIEYLMIFWVGCAILSWGISFAHFQKEYPERAACNYELDKSFSMLAAMWGPLTLMAVIITFGIKKIIQHGLKFW